MQDFDSTLTLQSTAIRVRIIPQSPWAYSHLDGALEVQDDPASGDQLHLVHNLLDVVEGGEEASLSTVSLTLHVAVGTHEDVAG